MNFSLHTANEFFSLLGITEPSIRIFQPTAWPSLCTVWILPSRSPLGLLLLFDKVEWKWLPWSSVPIFFSFRDWIWGLPNFRVTFEDCCWLLLFWTESILNCDDSPDCQRWHSVKPLRFLCEYFKYQISGGNSRISEKQLIDLRRSYNLDCKD